MQIWEMESYPCGDRRMPHHVFPPKFLSLEKFQQLTGINYYKIDLDDTQAMKKRLTRIKADYNVNAADIFTMDENMENFDQKLEAMYEPVENDEITVCLVIEGGMYYDVEYEEDQWVRVHLERGDLIIIPKDKCHRSTTTPKNFVKVQRFIKRIYS